MKVGDLVIKKKGDYVFQGPIVTVFKKLSGAERVVVENQDGILHIFNPSILSPLGDNNTEGGTTSSTQSKA